MEEKMEEKFVRTGLLLGEDGVETLAQKHVAVFGIGGVGGYVVEALVRSGIGEITIVDKDEVAESNINPNTISKRASILSPNLKISTQFSPLSIHKEDSILYRCPLCFGYHFS